MHIFYSFSPTIVIICGGGQLHKYVHTYTYSTYLHSIFYKAHERAVNTTFWREPTWVLALRICCRSSCSAASRLPVGARPWSSGGEPGLMTPGTQPLSWLLAGPAWEENGERKVEQSKTSVKAYCPTLAKGSKWHTIQIWVIDVFIIHIMSSSSRPNFMQKHSSY